MVSVCLPSDTLLQHLPSYLGFFYLGHGVSLHGCSSKAQPLLLTLDEGYLLTAAIPDCQRGIAPLGPPVPGKFGLGMQNEAGQRLIEFCQENALVIANTLFQQHKRRLYTWTSQVVNTEIRLIMFFAAKHGEALYSQQKQDQELTVAQTMNSLLPNSDSN